jgi:hypothetical protein
MVDPPAPAGDPDDPVARTGACIGEIAKAGRDPTAMPNIHDERRTR